SGQEEREHMVTNYPHSIASHDDDLPATAEDANLEGFGGRVIDRLRQMYCGLHGHDTLLQFEQDRMFLRCVSCGHETPGWELNETPPTVTGRGDPRPHRRAGAHLISARRIAKRKQTRPQSFENTARGPLSLPPWRGRGPSGKLKKPKPPAST